ncbi:MAG: porin [Pseudomonadota bacterium]
MGIYRNMLVTASAAMLGAGAAAQSQVSIYGIVGTTLRHASNAATPPQNALEDGSFYASRIGFQGTEDLGGGNKAFFTLEMGIDPTTGTLQPGPNATGSYGQAAAPNGRGFGRQSYVGISTDYGTVTLGRQYTLAHTLSGRFQPQTNPNAPALSVLPQWQIARWDNMLKYDYTLGPLGLSAAYAFSEGNGKAASVGGLYKSGALEVDAYYEQMDSNGAAADTRRVGAVGGSYQILPTLKGFAGFMKRTQRASTVENNIFTTGLLYDLTGALQLTLALTADRQSAVGGTAQGKRSVGFGALEYRFSKRTSVYVEVDRNNVTGGYALPAFMIAKGQQTGISLGIQHRF